jgi:NAD(P)-dependent dehydrogenase (short-subunit alcohol dehydrogenase family)
MENGTVVITGGNSGIGKETAVTLAGLGYTVVLACRNHDRAEAAAADIRSAADAGDVHVVPLDLADLASVRACADQVLSRWDSVHVLINNAGGIWTPRSTTAQGFEQTFGVNHVGPFYLTALLLDHLKDSAPARIVNVSSFAHHAALTGMAWDDLQSERRYTPFAAYCRSKLANLLFTRELANRLAGTSVTANALHPGAVRSGFGMDGDLAGFAGWGNRLVRPFEITATAGAGTVVYLATSPDVATASGGYYAHARPGRMSQHARSNVAAARLWVATEHLITEAGFELPGR